MKPSISRLSFLFLVSCAPAEAVWGQGFSPEEAVKRMQVPEGFEVKLAACEPDIRQPLSISFDDRGRMWVLQYIQYPNPAGLKAVQVDRYLRTVYDKLPEPPPRGPKGADKITILEDKHGTGRYRPVRDFINGLNLASGFAIGHGGVFVVQPPYLIFYPDRNRDDIPDSDPEVLLTGFGMEDAHAFANSLQWGPDGWLYGAQGSTVTAHIRGITFQQGIWRYHPITKEFELFAEGGGNTFGLDFDRHGNAIAGTNYGNAAMLHQVQGAYYVKNFGKHGELQNPHAYGYFDHVPHKNFKGGHVTCGGIVYMGGSYPKEFEGMYIAANLLSNAVYWHMLEPKSSTFTSRFGGDFLIANDTWFRPVDCFIGPDGSLYIADWYDKRANHVDPIDNWDKTNGRVYKVEARGTRPVKNLDLSKKSSPELVEMLSHPDIWMVREARRLMAERRDASIVPVLCKIVCERHDQIALEALWALYVSGGFDERIAGELLQHPNEYVRSWTVRLLGDPKKVSPAIQSKLVELGHTDPSCIVRCQLACSCKRLPAKDGLPIVRELLQRNEDSGDPFIPLLLWWAIEDKAISDRDLVLELLDTPQSWRSPIMQQFIVERLGRRYLAEGSEAGYAACRQLVACAPQMEDIDRLIKGMDKALEGRALKQVPHELAKQIEKLCGEFPQKLTLMRLALRLGIPQAFERAMVWAADSKAAASDRVALLEVLGQSGKPECVGTLLAVFDSQESAAVRAAALSALQRFAEPAIAARVMRVHANLPPKLRSQAQALLLSRPGSTLQFLKMVDAGEIDSKEIAADALRRIALYKDKEIERIVEKHWGRFTPATAGEKLARIGNLGGVVLGRGGPGNAVHGKVIFDKKCAVCHSLFGEGGKVGPDLTGTDRRDRAYLLQSIVDPSAVIRKEYVAYVINTNNGRLLTGVIASGLCSIGMKLRR